MSHKWGDRVRESTVSTGTGSLTLAGAATGGYQAFSAVCLNGDTVYYTVSDPTGSKWEVGVGTWGTGNLLARSAGNVLNGSSGVGVLVSFDAGSKDVFLAIPIRAGALLLGGTTIASASALPLPTGKVVHVSGTTTITSITSTLLEVGTVVTLVFDDVLTVVKGGNLNLDADFLTDAGCSLTLGYDGTDWNEIARCHMSSPMGEVSYFNTTGTAVTISAQSDGSTNMVKVAPVTSGNFHYQFDNGGANDGRLRYTGSETLFFHIALTWSAKGAANNRFVFGVAKNGSVIASGKVIQDLTTTSVQGSAIHVAVSMVTNDYLELFVGNLSAVNNVTVLTLNLFAMGMP